MGLPAEIELTPTPFYRHTAGQDEGSNLTEMPDDAAYAALNMEAEESGMLGSRPGCTPFLSSRLSAKATKIFDFHRSSGVQYILAWNGSRVDNITSGTPAALLTGISTPGLVPGVTVNNDYCIWGDGVNPNKKTNGTDVWNLSVPAAGAFPTLNTATAGSITLTIGQRYVCTAYNSVTGEEGNPFSPLDLSGAPNTGVITSKRVDVTQPAGLNSDPQVTHWRIYKTDDGGGVFKRHAEVAIGTTTYQDNVTVPATNIVLEVDNDAAPLSELWEEYQGSTFGVDTSEKTRLFFSKIGNNSAYPPENEIFCGINPNDYVVGLKKRNNLLWIMCRFSSWILNDHPSAGARPIRVADRGSCHKYAFDGSDQEVYSVASNGSVYKFAPTEFSLSEIRYSYRSFNAQKTFDDLNKANLSAVRVLNYASKRKNQIFFAIPFGAGQTKINRVMVFDTVLAKMNERQESWWPFRFMFDISSMDLAKINGEDVILFGDEDGNVFKYPGPDGDGAQENGTATGGSVSSLTNSGESWTVDEFKGLYITLLEGPGAGQERKIDSNTATQINFVSNLTIAAAAGTQYTIGGYSKEWYSNWKNFGLEAIRKVFRYLRVVGRQGGNWTIDVIFKRDFDQGSGSVKVKTFNLAGSGSLWGQVLWGFFLWGAATVVRNKIKFSGKFNSCQVGFRNRQAGQDFQIEGFTTYHQNLWHGTRR